MTVSEISRSPIGRKVKVRGQRIYGVVQTFRTLGNGNRIFRIETTTGDRFEVTESDCVFEGEAEEGIADQGQDRIEQIPMKEYARRIVAEEGFAATVSPQAMQALARDYLDLARRVSN